MKAKLDDNAPGADGLFVLSGLVTGVLALVAFVAEGAAPSNSPTVLNYALSQSDQALFSFRSFAWGLFAIAAIPFFVMLARSLRIRSERASVATFLSVVGVTLYALRGILQDAAFTTAGTTAAPSATTAAYQANLLSWTVNPLLPLGGAMWGLGFVFFGVLARNSGVLPKGLTIVAVVGGVAAWAIFPALNLNGEFIGYLFTEILLPFTTAIWCFGCATTVLRQGRGKQAAT